MDLTVEEQLQNCLDLMDTLRWMEQHPEAVDLDNLNACGSHNCLLGWYGVQYGYPAMITRSKRDLRQFGLEITDTWWDDLFGDSAAGDLQIRKQRLQKHIKALQAMLTPEPEAT